MHLLIVLLLVLLVTVQGSVSENSLCLNRKSNNTCQCYLHHGKASHRLSSVADCSKIDLDYFPNPSELVLRVNVLGLSYNRIQRLDQNNYVLSYEEVHNLDLSHNLISYINNDFFVDIVNLTDLNLSYNNITSFESDGIFASLKLLQRLDLSFNNLQVVEAVFSPLTNLRALDLSYNNIHKIFSNSTKKLKDILALNGEILDLRLDQLGITSTDSKFFEGLDKVKHLSLADNLFEDVPSVPHSVEYLDLSGCGISRITSKDLNYISLKTLKLDRLPKLTSIERYSFYQLPELRSLSIRNCRRLKSFELDVFGVTAAATKVNLNELLLSGDNIKTLDENFTILFTQLEHLDLNNNPWNCDCSLLWLTSFKDMWINSDDIRCGSPRRLENREFFKLVDSDLPDCYPEKYGKRIHRILIPILVALVIMLSMLVIYLIYYAPFYRNDSPPRTLAPNSPYSQNFGGEDELL